MLKVKDKVKIKVDVDADVKLGGQLFTAAASPCCNARPLEGDLQFVSICLSSSQKWICLVPAKVVEFLVKQQDIDLNCQDKQVGACQVI